MERRKILLGSGAVFATVLAGCSSADGNKDENSDDDGDDGDGDDGGDSGRDDIPGFAEQDLSLEEDHVEVRRIERKGNSVEVVIRTTILNEEDLEAHLEELSEKVADAIHDPEAFAAEIDKVYGTVVDAEGNELTTFYVEVDWALDYADGELTAEEFSNKVLETVD